jgi:hypothetical protein
MVLVLVLFVFVRVVVFELVCIRTAALCGVGEPGPVGNIWRGPGPFEWNLDRLGGWGLDLACLFSSVHRN